MEKIKSTQDRTIDLRSIGGVLFEESTHKYTNAAGKTYKGMTTFLKEFKNEMDTIKGAKNSAIKKVIIENFGEENFNKLKKQCKDEYVSKNNLKSFEETKHIYGHHFLYEKYESITKKYPNLKEDIDKAEIEYTNEWKAKSDESLRIGSLEHDLREQKIKDDKGYWFKGTFYHYVPNKHILNISTDDVVIVPECLVWDHENEVGGLSDIKLFNKGVVHCLDYKTNEQIKKQSFNGIKMKGLFSKYDDCEYYHYSAQLIGYQKMAIKLRNDFIMGDSYIISTKSEKYNREEDELIKTYDLRREIDVLFDKEIF